MPPAGASFLKNLQVFEGFGELFFKRFPAFLFINSLVFHWFHTETPKSVLMSALALKNHTYDKP